MSRQGRKEPAELVVQVSFEKNRLAPAYLAEAYEQIVPPAPRVAVGCIQKRPSKQVENTMHRTAAGVAA
jgi:hypothetical protein